MNYSSNEEVIANFFARMILKYGDEIMAEIEAEKAEIVENSGKVSK